MITSFVIDDAIILGTVLTVDGVTESGGSEEERTKSPTRSPRRTFITNERLMLWTVSI